MDKPDKLATQGTEMEDNQNKTETQCVRNHYAQAYSNNVNKT